VKDATIIKNKPKSRNIYAKMSEEEKEII